VANALVSLYARHAFQDAARRLFVVMPSAPDVVSYNTLATLTTNLAGHADCR
jgi:hypothetical protein